MQALAFICSYYFLLLLTEIQINLHALNECNNAPSHKDAHEDRKPSQDIEFQKKIRTRGVEYFKTVMFADGNDLDPRGLFIWDSFGSHCVLYVKL